MNPSALFPTDSSLWPLTESGSNSTVYQRILGDFLEQQGFGEREIDRNGILYVRFDLFLHLQLDLTAPTPGVVLEFSERPCDPEGFLARLFAWQAIPDEQKMRGQWMLQTEQCLETAMLEIQDALFKATEKHLWLSQDALKDVVSRAPRALLACWLQKSGQPLASGHFIHLQCKRSACPLKKELQKISFPSA